MRISAVLACDEGWIGLTLIVMLVAGCARTGYSGEGRAYPDARVDARGDARGDGRIDARVDAHLDGHVDSQRDSTADSQALKPFRCGAPKKVGSGDPSDGLISPVMRVDGLTLMAWSRPASTWYMTKRPSSGQPFGAWSSSVVFANTVEDPSFFRDPSGQERVIVAYYPVNPGPRSLEICTPPTSTASCQPLNLSWALNAQPITFDMDGVQVVTLPDGSLLMAHNVGPGGGYSTGDICLAHLAKTGDLLHWVSAPVLALSRPDLKEDDPALSADGLIIMFSAPGPGQDKDLWVSQRASLGDPFPAPILLEDVNSTAGDTQPSLVTLPGGKEVELFLTSERSGGSAQIFRSVCSR